MSMNMLPMQFDREVGPPSRLQILIGRMTPLSRRARFTLSAALVLFIVCLYFATTGGSELYDKSPTSIWRPNEETTGGGMDMVGHEPIIPAQPPSRFGRAEKVKQMFIRAYDSYEKYAFPHDEITPLNNGYQDNFNGWGVSLMDSLDTMVIMGLTNITEKRMPHVAKLTFDQDINVQFFETVIRYLGGLLSAYSMTGNVLYLSRADDLGRKLLPAFNTPAGFPYFWMNPSTGKGSNGWAGNNAILSEVGSCQMEYRLLGHYTGRAEYIHVADRITQHLRENAKDGLFAMFYDLDNSHTGGDVYSAGARADSAYEYLLKLWLMTGKTEKVFLDMYLKSSDAIIDHLLYISPVRKLMYATDIWSGNMQPQGNFQHLTCFLAGLFALGAATIPNLDIRHSWVAEGLAHTCWVTYADSKTGLGPDVVQFPEDKLGRRWVEELEMWENAGRMGGVPPGVNQTVPVLPGQNKEYRIVDPLYRLRPETVESFYILYRTTGDPKWQERGWAIFEAIEKHTAHGESYATVGNVDELPAPKLNEMPSFFLAETLKYLYLLFNEHDLLPLDKWVFNTEAHPFPVFTWSSWEKELFGLIDTRPSEQHTPFELD